MSSNSLAAEKASAPMTPTRKRKRNLSTASIPDICSNQLPHHHPTNQSSSPAAPQPRGFRGFSPRIFSDDIPSSPADTASLASRDTSPIFEKVLQYDRVSTGSSSPRSVVARRLSHMQIEKGDSDSELDVTILARTHDESPTRIPTSVKPVEVAKECKPHSSRTPLQRQDSGPPKKRIPPPRGIRSPPPKGLRTPPSKSITALDPSTPESNNALDNWLDLSALTWQDSEITGHLMMDSDDDGYGINGIGFRPTPAMASARSKRRKQQVSAWKTREDREERERRAEKRRQGNGVYRQDEFGGPLPALNLPSITDTLDKKVRFSV